MTKEVLLRISGIQLMNGEDEKVEVITAGDYYYRNGKHYVLYEDVVEGTGNQLRNTIKVGDGCLEVSRKGTTNVRLVFEKGRKHSALYQLPFGSMLVGIDTKELLIKESEDSLDIQVEYLLELGEEAMAECSIQIHVGPRGAGSL